MGDASQPSIEASHQEWTPIDVTVHNRRAHPFTQTGEVIKFETSSLRITSSRGFGRELPPTALTRPSLTSRRYTVDAFHTAHGLQQERDYTRHNYHLLPQDFTYPTQFQSEQPRVPVRETDETFCRQTQVSLPDPLRHRILHRWGYIYPPYDGGTYLRIGSAPLSNADFHEIMQLHGYACWYKDNTLDAAMEIVSLYHQGEANGIAVAESTTTQAIQFLAKEDSDADMNAMRSYEPIFENKKWIFIPLNDGIGQTTYGVYGAHWALLVIDRPNKRAHYIDGLGNYFAGVGGLPRTLTLAFQKFLGDEEYEFFTEWNAPHQWNDNFCTVRDEGPCGAYVVKMVNHFMSLIRRCQIENKEADIKFNIPSDFRSTFGFNSWNERINLLYTLAGVKASQIANERATKHDDSVLGQLRQLGHIKISNPAPLLYDVPLFTEFTLTFRESDRHRALAGRQRQRDLSTSSQSSSQSSSGSSGGIMIISDPSEGYMQEDSDDDLNITEAPESTSLDPPHHNTPVAPSRNDDMEF